MKKYLFAKPKSRGAEKIFVLRNSLESLRSNSPRCKNFLGPAACRILSKTYITLGIGILLLLSPVFTSFADTPSIVSWSVPTSLESGQIASLAWTINGGGHSITIFCSQGIKLRYASTNQTFPCDTAVSVSLAASDGVSVIVANVSGNPRIITVKLTPKDGTGLDYAPGAQTASIYVNPSRQPVKGFYTDATTTVSGKVTNFYWTSDYLDGVNFKIACDNSITATSSALNASIVPCGQTIFPADLPGSGSVSLKFKNSASGDLPLDVTILPAMSPGVYDGTHASTLSLTIASDAQKPVALSYFTASRQKVFSGDSVAFYWSFVNALGANLKLSCSPYGTYSVFSSATTTTLPCNDYAWANALGPTGSTSITFFNPSMYDQISTIAIFPELNDTTYDGSKSASLKITVTPIINAATIGTTTIIAPPVTSTTSATGTQPSLDFEPSSVSVPLYFAGKNIFKRPLTIGSRGADVTALQTFLAKDKSTYPEGYITGYLGAITERAIGKFQIKHGLVKTISDPGYGFIGPKTRAYLNSI